MKKLFAALLVVLSIHSFAAVEDVSCEFDDINPDVTDQKVVIKVDSNSQKVTLENTVDKSKVDVYVKIRYNDPTNDDIYIEEGTEGKYKVTINASRVDSRNPSVAYTATSINEGAEFPLITFLILTRNIDDEKIALKISCK